MKRTIFIAILSSIHFGVFAQNSMPNNFDAIYLKNNEVHIGTIIKNEYGILSLEITDEQGNRKTRQFQQFDIAKIIYSQTKNTENDELESNIKTSTSQTNTKLNTSRQSVSETPFNTLSTQLEQKEKILAENTQHQSISLPYAPSWGTGKRSGVDASFDPFSTPKPRRRIREWTRKIRGYRGFVDYGYSVGIGKHRNNGFEYSVSQGVQFNPIFYLGVGTSYKLSANGESSLPVFINPRLNLLDNEDVVPFWDVKLGYSVMQAEGFYFSTGAGTSFIFGPKGKFAFNLGLYYSIHKVNFKKDNKETQNKIKIKEDNHSLGLKITFEY